MERCWTRFGSTHFFGSLNVTLSKEATDMKASPENRAGGVVLFLGVNRSTHRAGLDSWPKHQNLGQRITSLWYVE